MIPSRPLIDPALQNRHVSSRDIGKLVMQELKALDQVAYVRFASVYREFKDVDQFLFTLKGLLENPKE